MYKKIILSLLFLPVFYSNQLLCIDPATICGLILVTANIATPVIQKTIDTYLPTAEQQVINAEAQERLNYLNLRNQYKNCLKNSKPDSEQTVHEVPIDCKKIMFEFILCGSENEVIAITTNFNKYKD